MARNRKFLAREIAHHHDASVAVVMPLTLRAAMSLFNDIGAEMPVFLYPRLHDISVPIMDISLKFSDTQCIAWGTDDKIQYISRQNEPIEKDRLLSIIQRFFWDKCERKFCAVEADIAVEQVIPPVADDIIVSQILKELKENIALLRKPEERTMSNIEAAFENFFANAQEYRNALSIKDGTGVAGDVQQLLLILEEYVRDHHGDATLSIYRILTYCSCGCMSFNERCRILKLYLETEKNVGTDCLHRVFECLGPCPEFHENPETWTGDAKLFLVVLKKAWSSISEDERTAFLKETVNFEPRKLYKYQQCPPHWLVPESLASSPEFQFRFLMNGDADYLANGGADRMPIILQQNLDALRHIWSKPTALYFCGADAIPVMLSPSKGMNKSAIAGMADISEIAAISAVMPPDAETDEIFPFHTSMDIIEFRIAMENKHGLKTACQVISLVYTLMADMFG